MDPNATLEALRELVRQWHEADDLPEDFDATRALELFDALDTWLKRGGFLPTSWERK